MDGIYSGKKVCLDRISIVAVNARASIETDPPFKFLETLNLKVNPATVRNWPIGDMATIDNRTTSDERP